jgi:hypothetical protein
MSPERRIAELERAVEQLTVQLRRQRLAIFDEVINMVCAIDGYRIMLSPRARAELIRQLCAMRDRRHLA